MIFAVAKRNLLSFRRFATLPSQKDILASTKAQSIFQKGLLKWNQDDIPGAIDAFKESIKEFPTSDAYFNLANSYHSEQKYQKALESWQKSLELNPRADAHVNIANVLAIVQKEPHKAIKHYESAIELEPTDGEINYNFAVVLDSMGELDRAIEQYSIAVSWGIEQAEKNLRNARARWIAKRAKQEQEN